MGITYTGTGGGVPRKTAKIFAKNAASGDMTVFGSTLAGNTVYSQDLDSIQSSHYEVGWREGVISDLNYPLMSDMNAVQKTLSQQIAYGLQHGIPEWDAGTTYYAYDIVQSGGILYTSIIDNNTNNAVGDTTKWAVYYNPAEFDNYANKSLSNLNSTGEKHFVNKSQVTNCILEAPSTEALSANNTTLTLAAGTKLLIPNGRYADGTLNNTEITIPSGGLSFTYNYNVALTDEYIIYSIADGLTRFNKEEVYFLDNDQEITTQTGSSNIRFAYILQQNTWWRYIGNMWNPYPMTIIGRCDVAANNVISNLRQNYPISIFTDSSTSKHYIARCAMPSSMGYETLVWGSTGTNYTAPKDGYFTVWRDASSDMDFICLSQILEDGTIGLSTVASTSRYDQSIGLNYMHIFLPAKKGQTVNLTYRGTGTVNAFKFVYAEGASV